jgi:hypothetical protein
MTMVLLWPHSRKVHPLTTVTKYEEGVITQEVAGKERKGLTGCCGACRLQQQLKALGVAGLAAYGLFNTAYYTGAFLFCWVYVAKVPLGERPPALQPQSHHSRGLPLSRVIPGGLRYPQYPW